MFSSVVLVDESDSLHLGLRTMPDEKQSLISYGRSGLARADLSSGRIVATMVGEVLAAARDAKIGCQKEKTFKIADQLFCEPDYQQIRLWAASLGLELEIVLERLLGAFDAERPSPRLVGFSEKHKTLFADGRIIQLWLDMDLLPLPSFEWVKGLVMESLSLRNPKGTYPKMENLKLPLSNLRFLHCRKLGLPRLELPSVPQLSELWCHDNQLIELDLSTVPLLTRLGCSGNQLTELNVSAVPQLTNLYCSENQLDQLDVAANPQLRRLWCYDNQLTELDLSAVPNLTALKAQGNKITGLDLSFVPYLTQLVVSNNQLTKLDIRPLHCLKTLEYDKDKTRLIQRTDQHF